MAREIKTTIAVDGEAAFKRAINDANTSMRNLGTQLTLAQAQFKKDGDAMKLAETRSKALSSEIDQQEKIVAALEKAVEDSSKAYGENSEKAEKWQAELNRAKAKLVNLQSELTLNEAGLDRNGKAFDESSEKAADYQATLQNIGKNVSFEAITKGIGGITGTVEGAIEKVIDLSKKVTEAMKEAAQWADDITTEAIRNQLTVEDQQRMEYASKFADTSVDTIMSARNRIIKKMVSGWKNSEGVDMWDFLKIDVDPSRDPLDVMFELGEKLKNVTWFDKNIVRADEWSMEVFGKGFQDLLPLFNYGKENFMARMEEAPIISGENMERLTNMNDNFDKLESQLETLKRTALAELSPALNEIVKNLGEMLDEFNKWLETEEGKKAMEELSAAIQELFSGLSNVDFASVIDTVKDAITGLKDGLVWLAEHKQDIYNALKVIAAGFGLLEVTKLAANIGQIVNGFKGLGFGGNGGNGGNNGGSPTVSPTTGSDGTGTGISGWLASKWAAIKAGLAEVTPLIAQEAAVVAVAITPAVIAQKQNETEWKERLESAETAADALKKATGENSQDAEILLSAARAVGPKRKEDGSYETDATGWFLNMNPTQQAETVLQSLSDPKMRGILYSDFHRYGDMENDNVAGWNPWTMMMRYWGMPVEDAFGNKVTEPLSQGEIDELVSYIRDIYQKKVEEQTDNQSGIDTASLMSEAVAEMKINTQSTKAAAETVGGMDLRKFNGLPSELQTAVQRGAASGVSGIRVQMDGATVGRLVAPTVSAWIGERSQG